eukprot:CAMPEP_0195299688 /NCGR_PEP_ID=MMETSP0707-20130614/26001_1 /TAXON_ID=33640 /ORGANISM="Asterionellopsis glacialis, Strain CCMP134" /LENGTH=177 /DNA_ID=CAMNT_0040362151 /DNA_START=33 /DNA_END=566 /DNA_ORIENTATION=-
MSKQELQAAALEHGGVSYEESLVAAKLEPSIYERIGKEDGFLKLSQLFYDRVYDDTENQWFINIFSSSTKSSAIDNQYRFLVQTFGGPALYREKKGKYTRLAGRHANFSIGHRSASHWVEHMKYAMENHDILGKDDEAKKHLMNYFTYTSHYIVAAREYMREDQLSGGTQLDPGQNW